MIILNLPAEILNEIVSYLPENGYKNFRLSCSSVSNGVQPSIKDIYRKRERKNRAAEIICRVIYRYIKNKPDKIYQNFRWIVSENGDSFCYWFITLPPVKYVNWNHQNAAIQYGAAAAAA